MSGHTGALVLLNAQSGEVLAIASHPYFDPNQSEESWEATLTDPDAPLFNRATLGQYPPGTALGPFLLAAIEENRIRITPPNQYTLTLDGKKWDCAVPLPENATFYQAVAAGCPGASQMMGTALDLTDLKELYQRLGLPKHQISPCLPPPRPAFWHSKTRPEPRWGRTPSWSRPYKWRSLRHRFLQKGYDRHRPLLVPSTPLSKAGSSCHPVKRPPFFKLL